MQSAPPRHLLPRFPCLLGLSLATACASPTDSGEPCDMASSYAGYSPACQAVLALFPEESRLQIDGRLTAFLPPDAQPETPYGGLSGNPLTILLDEDLALSPESTLTFGPGLRTARIIAIFDAGEVSGVVEPTVVGED